MGKKKRISERFLYLDSLRKKENHYPPNIVKLWIRNIYLCCVLKRRREGREEKGEREPVVGSAKSWGASFAFPWCLLQRKIPPPQQIAL